MRFRIILWLALLLTAASTVLAQPKKSISRLNFAAITRIGQSASASGEVGNEVQPAGLARNELAISVVRRVATPQTPSTMKPVARLRGAILVQADSRVKWKEGKPLRRSKNLDEGTPVND